MNKMVSSPVKTLRTQIHCSITQAVTLLKQTDNNVDKAISLFHQQNLERLCKDTGSNLELAQKYYANFHQDIEKTQKKLEELMYRQRKKARIFTLREDKTWKYGDIVFSLYGIDDDDQMVFSEQDYSIEQADFVYIEPAFHFLSDHISFSERYELEPHHIKQVIKSITELNNTHYRPKNEPTQYTHLTNDVIEAFRCQIIEWLKKHVDCVSYIVIDGHL